jgi:hypothetical protein
MEGAAEGAAGAAGSATEPAPATEPARSSSMAGPILGAAQTMTSTGLAIGFGGIHMTCCTSTHT